MDIFPTQKSDEIYAKRAKNKSITIKGGDFVIIKHFGEEEEILNGVTDPEEAEKRINSFLEELEKKIKETLEFDEEKLEKKIQEAQQDGVDEVILDEELVNHWITDEEKQNLCLLFLAKVGIHPNEIKADNPLFFDVYKQDVVINGKDCFKLSIEIAIDNKYLE